jgi:hypothetical protein
VIRKTALFWIFVLAFICIGCTSAAAPSRAGDRSVSNPTPTFTVRFALPSPNPNQQGSADPILVDLATQAIQAIQRQDFLALAALVQPDGLRFSPYSYLSPDDQVFTPNEVASILASSKIYRWGTEDGSGRPIELSFPAYYHRYIYDVDFARPEIIRYNLNLESASRINNILEIYPGAQIVEYYFTGFDPQFEGMDWRSLRLVFLPNGVSYSLAGIVHDEWGP